jgi:thymidine kinase
VIWIWTQTPLCVFMAKLFFRYGAVSSAKTLNLLAVAHSYQAQGKRALVAKPALDDRFGKHAVRSRAGLERVADFLIASDTDTDSDSDAPGAKREAQQQQPPLAALKGCDLLLVDEAQFLSARQVEHLRRITDELHIPIICYGLRTDFRTQLFPGSKRLMELADAIEEIKTTCAHCNRKALYNLKLVDGKPTRDGPAVELGVEDKYLPVCSEHYGL